MVVIYTLETITPVPPTLSESVTYYRPSPSVFMHVTIAGDLRVGANLLTIALSFLGYSLPMFAVFDMVENSVPWYLDARFLDATCERPSRPCAFVMRLLLTGMTILLGVLVPHFTLMVAFIGNFTGSCIIFLFPCIFYLKLKFIEIRWYEIFLNVFIVLFGVVIMAVGLLFTGRDLVETYTREGVDY